MIELQNNTRKVYHAVFKRARREKIRAVRLSPLLWYCARVESGHGEYLVRFHEIPEISGDVKVFVECRSVDGDPCKGTWRRQGMDREPMCVHIAHCIDRAVQYGKRKQKIESQRAA